MEYPKNIHRSCQYYGEKSYSDYAGVFSIIKVTRKKNIPSNDSDIVNTITDWCDQKKKEILPEHELSFTKMHNL